jgi:predicted amidophosphoribosyltransferase
MVERDSQTFEVVCPCCGARLKIDAALGKVLAHEAPPKHAKPPDLGRAAQFLDKEAARREALFKQSAAEQKTKGQLLERKFEEALKKSKDEPTRPPIRDIDLD